MPHYLVRYDGLWLGGKAVVFAYTEEEAVQFAREDASSISFEDVTVEKLPDYGVIYNDNGNY